MESKQGAPATGPDAYNIDLKNRELKIGSGTFADVHKIFRKQDNKLFAAKVVKVEVEYMREIEKLGLDREMKVLQEIDYPLVMKNIDSFEYNEKFIIVTNFASEGDFEKVI